MKIKRDFVTNSSSTSFLIAFDDTFSYEVFMDLMGIDLHSPLAPIYNRLFEVIENEMRPFNQNNPSQIRDELHPNVIGKINNALKSGKKVFIGRLSSENGDSVEAYFCTDSFEVENEHVYFNCLDCIW